MASGPALIAPLALATLMRAATCSRVTPPPIATPFEGAARDPLGSTSFAAFGGLAGNGVADGNASAGLGVRVAHQLETNVSVGVDGTTGTRVRQSSNPDAAQFDSLAAGRLHVRASPGVDGVALTFGVGGGASNNSLRYMTIDGGLRVAPYTSEHFEFFLAGTLAASLPVQQPDGVGLNPYRTTIFTGGDVGVVVRPIESLALGADLGALGYSYDTHYEWTLALMASVRYTFIPSGGRRTQ